MGARNLESSPLKNIDSNYGITKIFERLLLQISKFKRNDNKLYQVLNGQLLTSLKAIKFFKLKGPLIIHNCDTFYKCDMQENINFLKGINVFGVIPFFKGKGNNWSFIKTANAKSNLALEVKKKERISDNCSVGTYIFPPVKN